MGIFVRKTVNCPAFQFDSYRRVSRQMPRAERRTPRAGARGHPPARPTSDARGDGTRVCPGRGAPRFASGRRRGAGEVARRGVYVTFFAHWYSFAMPDVFLTATDTSAPSRADDARGARGAFRARRATRGVHRHLRRDHRRRPRAPRALDPVATQSVTFLSRMGIVSERVPRGM